MFEKNCLYNNKSIPYYWICRALPVVQEWKATLEKLEKRVQSTIAQKYTYYNFFSVDPEQKIFEIHLKCYKYACTFGLFLNMLVFFICL